MAIDKSIDSAQLDADLTSVADAIRTKGGTSAQLAFPADFVSAIEDIETGGGVPPTSAYIQTGLIHLWDAIETEPGTDSPRITKLNDLIGSADLTTNDTGWALGRDAIFPRTASAMYFASQSGEAIPQSAAPTVEFVISPYETATMYGIYIGKPLRRLGLFADNTVSMCGQSGRTYSTGLQSLEDLRSITGVYDQNASTGRIFVNGVECQQSDKTHNFSGDFDYIMIGQSGSSTYRPNYYLHCIRIYDRQLSDAEIAANYAVDVQRFFTNPESVNDILLGGV